MTVCAYCKKKKPRNPPPPDTRRPGIYWLKCAKTGESYCNNVCLWWLNLKRDHPARYCLAKIIDKTPTQVWLYIASVAANAISFAVGFAVAMTIYSQQ